jgi:phosphate transport system protein
MEDIRKSFHHDLDVIRDDIVRLASMVTEALGKATMALLDGDLQTANEIIEGDDVLDTLSLDIEERCYQLLALQQPMATDLRRSSPPSAWSPRSSARATSSATS